MSAYADVGSVIRSAFRAWKPPPRLSLSEWADRYFRLSAESAAEPGPWRTLPYQREIMDAFTDPRVERISVMKSARVGWTKIINAFVAYCIHWSPASVLLVQPTVDDAKGYSKEEIAPMLRDCPEVGALVTDDEEGPKDSSNTILHKRYPGGVLSMVGANSGTGFRRISRKAVLFDEVDGYPASAGSDGDPVDLGIKRTLFFWDRKIGAGSTPLLAGHSRIEQLFAEGDRRRYHVPCPQCGHMAPLVFREPTDVGQPSGHVMKWPEDDPRAAYFVCQRSGCVIEHKDKVRMVESGKWIAEAPFRGHASFHVWAAYSYAPNASWGQLAEEWVIAAKKPETLRTYVNTVLGETWREKGEAPDWERLYERRESYAAGTVPAGALLVTAGVDVQKDRFVYEVVAWGAGKESWSVDTGVIPADTSNQAEWSKLNDLLARTYTSPSGMTWTINMLAVDSGYNANEAYTWARGHIGRVLAIKGSSTARVLVGTPTPVDVKVNGRRVARGCKVWPVGVDLAKRELYGWLKLAGPVDGQPFPAGYLHFPQQHGPDYFKQMTAEEHIPVKDKRGFTRYEWSVIPGRENHVLDTRVYARAAAAVCGIDRMRSPKPRAPSSPGAAPAAAPVAVSPPVPRAPTAPSPSPPRGGFLGRRGDRFTGRGKPWLR